MEKQKYTTSDISLQRAETIEQQCRKMRSDAIAKGFLILLSANLFRGQKIELKPVTEEKDLKCSA